ncbi:MAG: hypothetical protein QM817_33745 [Archangium sp.]
MIGKRASGRREGDEIRSHEFRDSLVVVTAAELLALAELPASERDAALDTLLDLTPPRDSSSPGDNLIGYHASGLAPVCRAVLDVPMMASDVFIDLGAGRGRVVAIVSALTRSRTRGIELQPELVAAPARGVTLEHADARTASLDDGTVFFLYTPFTGSVLAEVLSRLELVARHHAIVVCALGFTLPCAWLTPRETDAFWLTIYDSVVAGVPSRTSTSQVPDERLVRLAHERR